MSSGNEASLGSDRRDERAGLVVAVTGGCGFLGTHIANCLLTKDWVREVRVLDVDVRSSQAKQSSRPLVAGTAHRQRAPVYTSCDVTNLGDVMSAIEGTDVIVHTVAIVAVGFMTPEDVAAVNVGGTETVLRACQEMCHGPRCMVYAGSVTACITGREEEGGNESIPLPAPESTVGGEYARTKNIAERIVLSHDGAPCTHGGVLRTCVLRCPPMYGEGDRHVVTPVLQSAKASFGVLPRVGGNTKVQVSYAGNVADAFAAAIVKITDAPAGVGGRAFFVVDDTPAQTILDFCEPILESQNCSLLSLHLPRVVMLLIAYLVQMVVALLALVLPIRLDTFLLTPARVRLTYCSQSFDGSLARRVLDYTPSTTPEEAMRRTLEFYRDGFKQST